MNLTSLLAFHHYFALILSVKNIWEKSESLDFSTDLGVCGRVCARCATYKSGGLPEGSDDDLRVDSFLDERLDLLEELASKKDNTRSAITHL